MKTQIENLLQQQRPEEALALFRNACASATPETIKDCLKLLLPQFMRTGHFEDAAAFMEDVLRKTAPVAMSAEERSHLQTLHTGVANMASGIDIGEARLGDRHFRMRVRPLRHTPPAVAFRSQLYYKHCLQTTQRVIGVTPNRIVLSEGRHRRWIPVELSQEETLRTVLHLTSGEFLFFSVKKDEHGHQYAHSVYIFDKNWNLLHRLERDGFPPYGVQSIDQSWSGTICYGEYAWHSESVRIWRSTDFGRSWTCALELPGEQRQEHPEHIRHFHVCQADPYIAGRWYALSGDREGECRLFISDDDGRTWTCATPEVAVPGGLSLPDQEAVRRRFLRTTALVIHEDSLFFASDDTLNGLGPSLARMEKQSPWRATVSLLAGDASLPPEARQSVRTLTDVGNGILCAITQQDSGRSGAGVFLCDTAGHTAFTGILPLRISGQGQSTTTGYHALSATPDGRFHTLMLAGTPLFYQSPRTLEWELIEETPREFLSGCPCCDTTLRTAASPVIRRSFACRDNPWEYRCPHCGSKTRNRTMWPLLRDIARQGRGRTLAFAASRLELDCLAATIADAVDNVAAHDRGPGISAGWDMRYLPNVQSETYLYIFASCVVDYIPEVMLAAREMYRILSNNGHFIFHIMPYRLLFAKDEQSRVKVTSFNALSYENYDYHTESQGGKTNIPDCTFSFAWLQQCLLDAGFIVTPHLSWDAWSQRHEFWFDAQKCKA